MNREEAKELLDKYNAGKASAEEKALLDNWYWKESEKQEFSDADFLLLKSDIWQATLERAGLQVKSIPKRFGLWPRVAAAAVILIGISTGLFFYLQSEKQGAANALYANDIAPGGNNATLTLANGKKISLTDANNGTLAEQSGIKITKSADGQLVYEVLNVDGTEDLNDQYNTIETPKGGTYQVFLPDGSKVVINAASSLKYPVSFLSKNERSVELAGEAYFEVAKLEHQPFKVKSGIQTVEVLGTHFNVAAYEDENAIKTTLLEGSVNVSTTLSSAIIKPGQQAIINRSDASKIIKKEVDPDKAISWVNNVFTFDGDDLKTFMKEVSRWYNVNVEYSGNIPNKKFYGEISRKNKLSEVFKILELNNVKAELQGRTVNVSYNEDHP